MFRASEYIFAALSCRACCVEVYVPVAALTVVIHFYFTVPAYFLLSIDNNHPRPLARGCALGQPRISFEFQALHERLLERL